MSNHILYATMMTFKILIKQRELKNALIELNTYAKVVNYYVLI